jgi:hypothetical protein
MNIVRVAASAVLVVVCAGCNVSVAAAGDTAAGGGGGLEWMLVACAFFAAMALPLALGGLIPREWRGHDATFLEADPEALRRVSRVLGRLALAASFFSAATLLLLELGDDQEWIGWSVVFVPMTLAGVAGRVYLRRAREDFERRRNSRRN